ncbi:MAG: DUF4124 domain-containing protein [Halieaceae bacterium]
MPVMNALTQTCLVAITLLCASIAGAQTVYKTVDESGAVSFSDKPPEADVETETLEIQAPPPSSDPTQQANLEAMRETTDRMAEDRREREKHRAEMRELQARTNTTSAESNSTQDYYDDYYPAYTGYNNRRYYNHRPPYRPGWKPKPEHPIARPPVRPMPRDAGSNNSQLMRPIVSSKR